MNVLSLFDGMSCGQIALERAGIEVDNYFASEIDKYAIKVTQTNYPDTMQLGDVTKIDVSTLPKIDLLLGGSPCQGFSFSGKGLNFEDNRSKLFFEYSKILNMIKPTWFMLENVKMTQANRDIITTFLKTNPIMINSNQVSAQNRTRLYWTNIKTIDEIINKNIELKDIVECNKMLNPGAIRGRNIKNGTIVRRRLKANGKRDDYNKDIPIKQCLEVRKNMNNKSNCITTVQKDNVLTSLPYGRYVDAFKTDLPFRYYTTKELCRLQTVPETYFDGIVSDNKANKMLGNGWTVDVIAHIMKGLLNKGDHAQSPLAEAAEPELMANKNTATP